MRIGHRMREILKVLNEAKQPMTLTDVIFKIKGLKEHTDVWYGLAIGKDEKGDWIYPEHEFVPYQRRLASALGERRVPNTTMGGRIMLAFINLKYGESEITKPLNEEVKTENELINQADKIYALYSRSMRILCEHDLVHTNDRAEGRWWKGNRCLWSITKKGQMRVRVLLNV